MYGAHVWGTFTLGSNTASAGTAFTRFVPAYNGGGKGGPSIAKVDGNAKLIGPQAYTHLSQIIYADTGTAHSVVVMRPLNWTYITEAVTANDTTIVVANDPGLYSTSYRYPLPGAVTKPAAVSNNAAASGDYVAFQLKDGTWHVSTITGGISSSTLTLGTATPNVTGGGADVNTVLYFFGVSTDSNPQTGLAHVGFTAGAGSTRVSLLPDNALVSVNGLNPGDPLLIYSANATNAGTLCSAAGFYSNR